MDFFQAQDQARKRTRWLLVLFIMAVVAIIAVVYVVASFILMDPELGDFWQWERLAVVSVSVGVVITLGSLFKIWQLSAGGSVVAEMLGGRRIDPATRDPLERRLFNVVEEMSIASGLPVPPVYVMDEELSINAFAAGFSPGDAAVGVTRGAMEKLNRDELQGVMAHEFSHILNGDMRLNLRLMGVLHGILIIAILGWILLRTSIYAGGGRDRNAQVMLAMVALGVVLMLVGYTGLFFAKLIKASVSRQREFLADAAAVQFTRNPGGIAGVLKKIGGLTRGSTLSNAHAEEASHLFFGNGVSGSLFGLLATHPPLEQRIRAVDPHWDGSFERITESYVPKPVQATERAAGGAGLPLGVEVPPLQKLTPLMVLAGVGQLRPRQMDYAHELLQSLPEPIKQASHETFSARALVLALVLNEEAEVRESQMAHLRANRDPAFVNEVQKLWEGVRSLPGKLRLPCVELAVPALRLMSPSQMTAFRAMCQDLIEADQSVDLFEFALLKLLDRHLLVTKDRAAGPPPVHTQLGTVHEPVRLLLSVLAYQNADPEAALKAGMEAIEMNFPEGLVDFSQAHLGAVDEALQVLEHAHQRVRRQVVFACAAVVLSDDEVRDTEGDLLRAIADALGCPMPPLQSLLPPVPES